MSQLRVLIKGKSKMKTWKEETGKGGTKEME